VEIPTRPRGRPQKRSRRPEKFPGFDGKGDANDFVRGAVYALGMSGMTQRDIGASVLLHQRRVLNRKRYHFLGIFCTLKKVIKF
jgi:hypothetical protein